MSDSPLLEAAGMSDTGRQRQRNEDAFVVAKLQRTIFVQETSLSDQASTWFPGAIEGWLFVVADGMGGHGGGDVASRVAIQTITNYLCNVMPCMPRTDESSYRAPAASLYGVRQQLTAALTESDSHVRDAARLPGASPRMGTTLTLAYVLWPSLYVAHVGDSRAYLIRNGELSRLTTDHTLAQQLIDQGFPGIDESSHLNHILWNALGATDSSLAPEVSRHSLVVGDRLVLCSDGLTKHVTEGQILETVKAEQGVRQSCQKLIDLANQGGGTDNVTVVVAHCGP